MADEKKPFVSGRVRESADGLSGRRRENPQETERRVREAAARASQSPPKKEAPK